MHEYRQVLSAMRLGESDRSIAKLGLVSRTKANHKRPRMQKKLNVG